MRGFSHQRLLILEWVDELTRALRRRGAEESLRRLEAARERLLGGRLTVVICGEFKRGKSSLLNALLDEPCLFPVDTVYATSLVTSVSYAVSERVVVTLEGQGGAVEQVVIPRAEIAQYATESGNPHNAKRARLITIATPNDRLKSGLTLVDTPGVGGVHAAHTTVTTGFLPSADALLFVIDMTQPLTESELEFLRRAVRTAKVTEDEDALLFVLTKTDIGDFGEMLVNTTEKLAEITGRPQSGIRIVPVSAQAKLAYLAEGDPEDLELSNFAELEEMVWTALNRRRTTVLLGDALGSLGDAVTALLGPLEGERAALRTATEESLADLRVQVQERERELDRLSNAESWRQTLADRIARGSVEVYERAKAELDGLWADVGSQLLYQDRYLDEPQKLLTRLVDEGAMVIGMVNELAARRTARIQRDLAETTGLTLAKQNLGKLPPPPVPTLDVSRVNAERTPGEQGMRKTQSMVTGTTTGGTVGATVGGAIGFLLLPGAGMAVGSLIGGALGSLFGASSGYRSAMEATRKQERLERRDHLLRELDPLRRSHYRYVQEVLDAVMTEFEYAVADELRSRISAAQHSTRDEAERLQRAGAAGQRAAAERLSELEQEIAPLLRLRDQIADLGGELV